MPIPGFVATLAYLTGGLIVWAVRFLAMYGLTGLYCARPDWPQRIAGIGVLPLALVLMSVAALAVNGAIGRHAIGRLRAPVSAGSANGRFVHATAAAVALLGTVAILWETLPLMMIPVCR